MVKFRSSGAPFSPVVSRRNTLPRLGPDSSFMVKDGFQGVWARSRGILQPAVRLQGGRRGARSNVMITEPRYRSSQSVPSPTWRGAYA